MCILLPFISVSVGFEFVTIFVFKNSSICNHSLFQDLFERLLSHVSIMLSIKFTAFPNVTSFCCNLRLSIFIVYKMSSNINRYTTNLVDFIIDKIPIKLI